MTVTYVRNKVTIGIILNVVLLGLMQSWGDAQSKSRKERLHKRPRPQPTQTSGQNSPNSSARTEWEYIVTTLRKYKDDNKLNAGAAVFSQQIHNIASLSYAARKETGGWAGDLVRESLLTAARDIQNRRDFWYNPKITSEETQRLLESIAPYAMELDPDLDIFELFDAAKGVTYVIYGVCLGMHHFRDHLSPALYKSIKQQLLQEVKKNNPAAVQTNIISRIKAIRNEHEKFLENGVKPGFDAVPDLPRVARFIGKNAVPELARELRVKSLILVLQEFVQEGVVSSDEVQPILTELETFGDERL